MKQTFVTSDGSRTRVLTPGDTLSNGATLLAAKRYSQHPDDIYLGVVIAKYNGKLVTWWYNADTDSCSSGHYYEEGEEAEAWQDYHWRER